MNEFTTVFWARLENFALVFKVGYLTLNGKKEVYFCCHSQGAIHFCGLAVVNSVEKNVQLFYLQRLRSQANMYKSAH